MELETRYSADEIRGLMLPFSKILEKTELSSEQEKEAGIISQKRNLPKGDAIHAILARDNKAILVSRDKHFQLLKDICIVMKPEEIIS